MLVPRWALNGRNPATSQCERGAEQKRRRLAEAETRESSERDFEAYGEPIHNVLEFRYLGRVLTAREDDWLAVVGNLGKARKSWERLYRVLGREGAHPKVSGNFYKAVAQAVLLFGAETWVLTQRMKKALDIFQSRLARRLTGKQPWQKEDRSWDYPLLEEALSEAGLEGIQKSTTRRQNMVVKYIATQPILDLCEWATRRPGERVSRLWWEQSGIDLEGERKLAAESTTRSEMESDREPNGVAGGEEESQGASRSSGPEWSGAEEG